MHPKCSGIRMFGYPSPRLRLPKFNIMPARHIDLVSHWQITAPADQVWAVLTQFVDWPRWWPQVRSSRTIRQGGMDGLGGKYQIAWTIFWPKPLTIELEVIEALRFERLRARMFGRPRGESIWLLRSEGGTTNITHVWRFEFARTGIRWLAPLLAPLLRWNHQRVMRAGAAGLTAHLRSGRG